MGVSIEYYIILALDLFGQLNLVPKVATQNILFHSLALNAFSEDGEMKVVKTFSGDQLRTLFLQTTYPHPFMMRLICTRAPQFSAHQTPPLGLLVQTLLPGYSPDLLGGRSLLWNLPGRKPPHGRLCFLSQLKFKYDHLSGSFMGNNIGWGCNLEKDSTNPHVGNHPDHYQISALSVIDRLSLNF